jgi:hypothetical protein
MLQNLKNCLLTLTLTNTFTIVTMLPVAHAQTTATTEILTENGVYPTFPNGSVGLYKHLIKQFNYPNSAWKKQLEGIVRVGFVVDFDGTVRDVEVIKGISLDIDEEVVRIFNLLPTWITAQHEGRRLKAKFIVDFPVELPNSPAGAALKPPPLLLVRY